MKTIIPFCLLFFSLHQVFAQLTALPSAQDNPVWRVVETGWGGGIVEYTYFTGADTFIDPYHWHSLYSTNSYDPDTVLEAFYRLEGKKAFIRPYLYWPTTGLGPEYLLYDFSAEVGDTLLLPNINPSNGQLEAYPAEVFFTSIYLENGVEHKFMLLSSSYYNPPWSIFSNSYTFIQGVGDIYHPFYYLNCQNNWGVACEAFPGLACLQTNQGLIYSSGNYPCHSTNGNNRLYVDKDAIGGQNNGNSWADAFLNLQYALTVADSTDEIWVAEGAYKPTAGTNRTASYTLKQGVAIYGGFNSTETERSQRNWELYPTILSGDIGVEGDSTDNSYHVLYALSLDSTTVLDGFTITGGNAVTNQPGQYWTDENKGGGLFVKTSSSAPDASPKIIHCTFEQNTAREGGAIYCDGPNGQRANPIIRDCIFRNNYAKLAGAAINKWGASPINRPFIVENCLFEYNRSDGLAGCINVEDLCGQVMFNQNVFRNNWSLSGGAAMFLNSNCDEGNIVISNSRFEDNTSDGPGGISILHEGQSFSLVNPFRISLSDNTFIRNRSLYNSGGAVTIENVISPKKIEIDVARCLFDNNRAFNYGAGLYVYVDEGSDMDLNVNSCVFNNNITGNQVSGAISVNGYAGTPMRHRSRISNSLFTHNTGALFYTTGPPGAFDSEVYNCTFFRNGPYPILKFWSTNFNDSTYYIRMKLQNSILWEPGTPLEHLLENGLHPVMYGYTLNNCLISAPACDLPGGAEACPAGNLFDIYPQFVDTLNGDFRLAACSPLIDMGLNHPLDSLGILTDLAGQPRIQQGTVDLGAYERPASWQNSVAEIIPPVCPDGQDGAVIVNSTGNEPLAFAWSQGSQNGMGNNELAAGNYQFTLTDAAGCVDTLSATIEAPAPFALQFAIEQASSPQTPNGSISIQSADGGAPPYHWLWSTGDTTASITNLLPGMYSLTLTDVNACEVVFDTVVGFVSGVEHPLHEAWFRLQPNPVRSGSAAALHYREAKPAISSILRLRDSAGRLVWQQGWQPDNESGQTAIPTTGLPSGIYLLTLQTGGEVISWKLAVIDR